MEEILPFPRLAGIEKYSGDFSKLGDDYIFSRILPSDKGIALLNGPVRINGLTLCVVLDGEITARINGRPFKLKRRSLMMLSTVSVLQITDIDWSKIEAYVLFISPQFLNDINLDINTISTQTLLRQEPSPIMELSSAEEKLLAEYMDLLHHNAEVNPGNMFSKNIARSLIQALVYQLMQSASNRTGVAGAEDLNVQNRRINYVQDFMKLVQVHHFKERSLTFYADKLFISPKYLSRIIKETTGRSAAEWIDQIVVLEAKNMLRFSNKNIQEIAYALNFSTQSSFGKFFKHITGMSPSEYQKT